MKQGSRLVEQAKGRRIHQKKLVPYAEGVVLLFAAPWLLFPSVSGLATTLALAAIALIWLMPWLVTRHSLTPTPVNGTLLLWVMAVAVGVLVTADPGLTLPKVTGLVLGLTVWRYLINYVPEHHSLRRAFAAFLLLGLGLILFGLVSAEWRVKIPFMAAIIDWLPLRVINLPEAPKAGASLNQLAGTILFYLPFLGSLLIGWRPKKSRRLAIVLTLLSSLLLLTLLLLTQSRSGWIGAFGGLLALLLMWGLALPPSRRRRAVWLSLVGILSITLIGLIWAGPSQLQDIWEDPQQQTAVGTLATLGFRQEVWQWATTAVADFPLTGTGLGTFRVAVRRLYPIAIVPTFDIAHAHNQLLQVALDVGLPGLVAYLAIIVVAFVAGWQVVKRDTELRPLSIGLLAGLVAVHVFGLTDALAPGSKTTVVFWILLGLICVMEQQVRQRQDTDLWVRIRPEKA